MPFAEFVEKIRILGMRPFANIYRRRRKNFN